MCSAQAPRALPRVIRLPDRLKIRRERGKWLLAEKDKRKAKEVDVSWLKEYKPAK